MRRIGIIFMLTLMITLSFCSCKNDNKKLADITKKYANANKYTAVICIKNSERQYKIHLTKNNKIIKAEIVEPEMISGFWVELSENDYKIGYKVITTSFNDLPVPANSILKNIFECINMLEGRVKELSYNKNKTGETVVSGKLENGISADITFDKSTFSPLNISFDNGENLSFEFESFEF